MKNANELKILRISDHEELIDQAADWFHAKWGTPKSAYVESMQDSLDPNKSVPEWYIIMDNETVIAGLGVIENDFHERKDLTPNICAVYVEKEYRNQGLAGRLLNNVCEEFKTRGIKTLYLITDHTSFYERYNWEYLCMVKEEDSTQTTRMYIHNA